MTLFEALPPHDLLAEASLCAALMEDDTLINRVAPNLDAADFFRDEHALTRWCRWCGSGVTSLGWHHLNGDFDPWSVIVSDAEVTQAIANAGPQSNDTDRERRRTHWCIAFGKHIGSYQSEAQEVERPRPVLATIPLLVVRPRAAFKKRLAAASESGGDYRAHRLIKAGRA